MKDQLYWIMYRGVLAAKTSSMGFQLNWFRARLLRNDLLKSKGWLPSDVTIVLAHAAGNEKLS